MLILSEYFSILVFIFLSLIISCILVLLAYVIVFQSYDVEKLSSYECGFQPFDDARNKFDIRFYLVAILFIIFDLEVSFLFPWSRVLDFIYFSSIGFYSMVIFLIVLTIGFVYEWMKGALDWE